MTDLTEWPPERIRKLDEAVALARGWRADTRNVAGSPVTIWVDPSGRRWSEPPEVSLGCRETFDLQVEFRIEVRRILGGWTAKCWEASCEAASTPQIAICLCWLAAKGVSFNG